MSKEQEFIKIRGAKEHNLKNIDVDIPRNKMVVLTGTFRIRKILFGI